MAVPFDRMAADLFIRLLYSDKPGLINVCYVPSRDADLRPGDFFSTTDQGIRNAVNYAADLARRSFVSIYIRTTTITGRPHYGRGHAKDTACCSFGWADLDFGVDGHKRRDDQLPLPPTAEDAFRLVAEAGLPAPTLWVFSGGGWYPIWQWSRPLSVEEAKELVERIQHLILLASNRRGWHYGSGVKDMARVLRLCGSSNMKTGTPRACTITGGTGLPVDPEAFPTAPEPEVVRKVDSKAAPPPKRSSAPYDPNTPRRPWDVFDELVEWSDLLEMFGLSYVKSDDYGDQWVRPGASSTFSLKVMHATSCVVNFSDNLDLPVRVGLTKPAVLSYMTGYDGDRSALLRDLLSGLNPARIPPHVITEMASVGAENERRLLADLIGDAQPTIIRPAPEVADTDVDDFIATFTRYDRPRALQNRETWMRQDGARALLRHACALVTEAANGWYPAEEAIRTILIGCRAHGADPDTAVKMALAAFLNTNTKASAS